MPRNIDPAVNQIENAYLYDLDDLQELAASNASLRRSETQRAEDIVLEEEQRFDGWLVALQAVPTIRRLRSRAETVRSAELSRAAGRLGLSDQQREGFEAITKSIVKKSLHAPISRLRAETDREEGLAMLEAARVLFALDDTEAPGSEADGKSLEDEDPEAPKVPE